MTRAARLVALIVPWTLAAAPPPDTGGAVGPTILTTVVPDATTVAVRVTVDAGLDDEREDRWGLATAVLAGLVHGPTAHLAQGEALNVAARAGLHTTWGVGPHAVHVTLSGTPAALELALWLAAERLDPRPMDGARALARLARADRPDQGPALPSVRPMVDCRGCDPREADVLAPTPVPTRGPYLLPAGDPLDHAYATLFGPLRGHTVWASRRHALAADSATLATIADEARLGAAAVISIAGPPEAIARVEALAARLLVGLPARRAAPARPEAGAYTDVDRAYERERPERAFASHDHDGRRFVTVGYDLRDLPRRLRWPPADVDAVVWTVQVLLGSAGGLLDGPLIRDHATARTITVEAPGEPAALLISAEVRGRDPAGARALLIAELDRLIGAGPPEPLLAGARERARASLTRAWRSPTARLALIARWIDVGRVTDAAGAEAYHDALAASLAATTWRRAVDWAEYALHPSRRVVVELSPNHLPAEERVVLDDAAIDTFLRLLVDLRCPPPGRKIDLVAHLEAKYDLTPDDYMALTRVVARDPGRMRVLDLEAEQRCLEYRKLRRMMSPRRLLELHREVACAAGRIDDDAQRALLLARIFRRFDIDPSVYRPMILMAREDLSLRDDLARVDDTCAPTHGPALETR